MVLQPLFKDAPAPLTRCPSPTLPKVLRLSLDPPLTSIFSHIMTLPYRICHPSPIPNYSVIFYLTYTLILCSLQPYYTLIARNISLTQIISFPKLQARPSPYPIPIPSHLPLQARPLTPSIQMNPHHMAAKKAEQSAVEATLPNNISCIMIVFRSWLG